MWYVLIDNWFYPRDINSLVRDWYHFMMWYSLYTSEYMFQDSKPNIIYNLLFELYRVRINYGTKKISFERKVQKMKWAKFLIVYLLVEAENFFNLFETIS